MDSCLELILAKLFGKPVYQKLETDEEIELVEHRYVVRNIIYKNNNRLLNLSNEIMFMKDGMQINGAFFGYEYIPMIHRPIANVIVLPTFTNIINNKIVKDDCISLIHIRFDSETERNSFSENLFNKMLYMKNTGVFDKSVLNLSVFKVFRENFQ